jgi:predicted MPP superfamily phosphohydrolase
MIQNPPSELQCQLERRLGHTYACQRLDIERNEQRGFAGGANSFQFENWRYSPALIRCSLKVLGLYGRGIRNAERVEVRQNAIRSARIPREFDGFTILHISDMHVDMNGEAMRRLTAILPGLSYDICVLTGDYRGKTYGPFDRTLAGLAQVCEHLKGTIYGVLGNHDTVAMVPGLERLGIQMLLNESEALIRESGSIYLSGVDDAHRYRAHDLEKAASAVPDGAFSILLSHTPEIYRQAAQANFGLLLSGHTHGGQICLPGSLPITLGCALPRRLGSGAWKYHDMAGYTSAGLGSCVVPVRFNCPPEITLHRLQCADAAATC